MYKIFALLSVLIFFFFGCDSTKLVSNSTIQKIEKGFPKKVLFECVSMTCRKTYSISMNKHGDTRILTEEYNAFRDETYKHTISFNLTDIDRRISEYGVWGQIPGLGFPCRQEKKCIDIDGKKEDRVDISMVGVNQQHIHNLAKLFRAAIYDME